MKRRVTDNNFNMPLETLPDRFDDATHQELDRAVNEAASDALSGPLISPIQYYYLLNHIVGHSKDDLDPKYLMIKEAKSLIVNCEELQDMLSSAWERRSYREIRNLGGCYHLFSLSTCLRSWSTMRKRVLMHYLAAILKKPTLPTLPPSVATTFVHQDPEG